MKIAMVIDAWDPVVGWWQVHVYNLCKKLIENQWCEIDLFVRSIKWDNGGIYNKNEYLLNDKLKIIRCGRSKSFFNFFERLFSMFSILFHIIKENKLKQYDLIHAHTFLWLIPGKLASLSLQIPIVATVHWANLLDKGKISPHYCVEKLLLTKIKYNTIVSVWSSFLKYPNINKNIVVIPNWVNVEEFDCVDIRKREDIFKILFVGRLEWTKGIDILIEAVNLLKEGHKESLDGKKVEFHLVGYWYQEDYYRNLIQKYSLWSYIKFKGLLVWKELIREYKESSLFVLPSRTEWFGITILESMAAHVPVLATRCGWPEDIIQNWMNWFLIEKENPNQLHNILLDFIELRIDILNEIIKNWYSTVLSKYNWNSIGEATFFEYKKLL
jgi:glycosyltransferase involved in cell wall biosynthesis